MTPRTPKSPPIRASRKPAKHTKRSRPRRHGRKSRSATFASLSDALLKQLQLLSEHDLTTTCLLPLFTKLGYDTVEYHGGPNEGGKDIICWGRNELDDRKLSVVQVEKFSFSARASDSEGFQEVVRQLGQATEKHIADRDGVEHTPSAVYFVSPFPLATRALESRLDGYKLLRSCSATVIDGPKLCSLLQKHVPQIAKRLCGSDPNLFSAVRHGLDNATLLTALASREPKDITTIFTDIDFSLGKSTTRMLLSCDFVPTPIRLALTTAEWNLLKVACDTTERAFGLQLLTETFAAIESRYESQHRGYIAAQQKWKAISDRLAQNERAVIANDNDLDQMLKDLQEIRLDRRKMQSAKKRLTFLIGRRDELTARIGNRQLDENELSTATRQKLDVLSKLEVAKGKINELRMKGVEIFLRNAA